MFYCKTRYQGNTKRQVISRDTVHWGPVNRGITVLVYFIYCCKALISRSFQFKFIFSRTESAALTTTLPPPHCTCMPVYRSLKGLTIFGHIYAHKVKFMFVSSHSYSSGTPPKSRSTPPHHYEEREEHLSHISHVSVR